jgi:hypothetical protein
MKEYKFYISECTYGVLKVQAESYEEALDKANGMDGDFFGHDTEILDVQPINE